MQKEKIHTQQAPDAIGPYVQAVRVGDLIYTSGQAGLNQATGKLAEGGIKAQAEQTMQNLAAVLEAAGSDFNHVVKTNIFLRYMKDFAAVNEVYASFFDGQFPARSTVAVSALPLAALVEIEMVALVIKTEVDDGEETQIVEKEEEPKDKKDSKKEDTPKGKKGKKKTKKSKGKKNKSKK